jgi:hypothetical protein
LILILVVQIVVVFLVVVPFVASVVVAIIVAFVVVFVAFFIIVPIVVAIALVVAIAILVLIVLLIVSIGVVVARTITVAVVVRILLRARRGLGLRCIDAVTGVGRDGFNGRLGDARFGLFSFARRANGPRLFNTRRRHRSGRCFCWQSRLFKSRSFGHRGQGSNGRGATTSARIFFAIFRGRSDDDRLLRREGARRDRPSQRRNGAALPHGFVEGDSRGHGNVERRHLTEDGQGDHVIAVLLHQPANAFAFTTQHQNDRPLVVDRVPSLLAGAVEAHDPEALGLQGFKRLHDVADAGDLHAFERARGGAGRGVRKRRGVSVGKNHAVRSRGVDTPNDRAKVPWILHTVEQHEERRCARALLKFLETQKAFLGHDREDALVALTVRCAIESLTRFETQGHAPLACALDDLEDPLVANSFGDDDAFDGARTRGQCFENGMNSTDYGHSKSLL